MMVDFPDPEAPTIAVNFPSGIANETFLSTVTFDQLLIYEMSTLRTRGVYETDVGEMNVSSEIWS